MISFAISIFFLLLFILSTYGWGRLTAGRVLKEETSYWAYTSALGLSCWIFIGGILNALKLAFPAALYMVFFSGLFFFFLFTYPILFKFLTSIRKTVSCIKPGGRWLVYGIPSVFVMFLIGTLLPTDIFNFIDDFHTYMPRPVRMLQAGTLTGNPFDILGLDSLGSQAFLQAFILLWFPIKYLNAFDAIFCFALSAFLLIEIGYKFKSSQTYVALALFSFIFINPLMVNISSVYSGSLMIIALFLSIHFWGEAFDRSCMKEIIMRGVHVAFFLSALISLKMTYIFFAAFFPGFCLLLVLILFKKQRFQVFLSSLFIGCMTAVFLLPWMYAFGGKYKNIIQGCFLKAFNGSGIEKVQFLNINELGRILNFEEIPGMGNLFSYNYLILLLISASLITLYSLVKNSRRIDKDNLILFSLVSTCIITYLIIVLVFPSESCHGFPRYAFPVIIAVFPLAVLSFSKAWCLDLSYTNLEGFLGHKIKINRTIVCICFISVLFGLFFNVLIFRINQAYSFRSALPYLQAKGVKEYGRYVMGNDQKGYINYIQEKTTDKENILALISHPFHLDFARNTILNMSYQGVANPWHTIFFNDKNSVVQYLKQAEIKYIIWEYNGYITKDEEYFRNKLYSAFPRTQKIAMHNLVFIYTMRDLVKEKKVLFDDGHIVAIELD